MVMVDVCGDYGGVDGHGGGVDCDGRGGEYFSPAPESPVNQMVQPLKPPLEPSTW